MTWLEFIEEKIDGRKTQFWNVRHKDSGIYLGYIEWKNSWRQYAFFTNEDTFWSAGCLDEVSSFIKKEMEKRKKKK